MSNLLHRRQYIVITKPSPGLNVGAEMDLGLGWLLPPALPESIPLHLLSLGKITIQNAKCNFYKNAYRSKMILM